MSFTNFYSPFTFIVVFFCNPAMKLQVFQIKAQQDYSNYRKFTDCRLRRTERQTDKQNSQKYLTYIVYNKYVVFGF